MKIEGTRFTLLREYSDYPRAGAKKRTKMWELQCECGKIVNKPKSQITSGHTKSCGCLVRDLLVKRNTTHGFGKEECRGVFYAMHRRCYNSNHISYDNYGGRGIKVCKEWHDIENFVVWCKEKAYKKGLQLDRIDNNGDYSPSNCRFVTVESNLRNTRRNIYKDGMVLKDWLRLLSEKHAIRLTTLHTRYYNLKRYGLNDNEINEDSIINYKGKAGQSITTPKEKS